MKDILKYGLSSFLLLGSLALFGQPFTLYPSSLPGAGRGEVSWADYDLDGDLDMALTGQGQGGTRLLVIYYNQEGVFLPSSFSFPGFEESDLSWGDYDNDNDLDLLVAGNMESGDRSRIFRNDGDGFIELDPGIIAVQNGDVCWVDIDGDADLDIFITGNWTAKIYYNDNGSFTPDSQGFGYFSSSAVDWGDYDNDGDPDLLINGDSGAGAVTKVFRNDAGSFIDIQASLPRLMAGTVHWVDYDNDGDLDLAISGFNDALEGEFHLMKNTEGNFSEVFTGINGFANGAADWGDYDNDGDLDMIMTGKANGCGAVVSGIYRNEGNDFFYKISDNFTTATRASLKWADLDNDGDLDFVVAGVDGSENPFTRIYLNSNNSNLFVGNTAPTEPTDLGAVVDGGDVYLSWGPSTDAQTPQGSLSYNLRIGTTSGGCDVVSPMANWENGFRKLPGIGNTSHQTYRAINELEPGDYYWSVQAIDQAFEGSAFSAEHSFTVITTAVVEKLDAIPEIKAGPNPFNDQILLTGLPAEETSEIALLDVRGKIHYTTIESSEMSIIPVPDLPAGIYLLMVRSTGRIDIRKIVKY